MQTAFRFSRNVPRTRFCLRLFSTTSRCSDTTRPVGTKPFLERFYKESRNPIWHQIDALRTPAGRAEVDGFNQWDEVITHNDIEAAVASLQALGYPISSPIDVSKSRIESVPSWVVLYLVVYKARTPAHASGPLLDLVYYHIPRAPAEIQGPLLILTAYRLARFNLLVPLRRVVNTFLTTPLHNQDLEFNLFLQALSVSNRSVESANHVVSILKAMEARQLKLRSQTYTALLTDRFVTLQLTKFLQSRMIAEGFLPTAAHLEAFLRVFSKNGAIHEASRYFRAIHHITKGPALEDEVDPRFAANTLLLNAQDKRSSAFAFLHALAQPSSTSTPQKHPSLAVPRREPRFVHRTNDDVYDQTAALHVAANDLTTSAQRLINVFLNMNTKPTVATHTVLVRGLLFRKEFQKAEIFWSKLAKSGLVIDRQALTCGLQALTRNGKPHAAFQLLEKYSWKPGEDPTTSHPMQVTTVVMNEFLVSLKRISRPDAVFRLWDYMGTLYHTSPNADTLSILLQSARLAYNMDDTLSGAIAKVKLLNPLRKRRKAVTERVQAVDEIFNCIGHRGSRGYTSGIWQDALPLEFARKVFLQAIFGNDTSNILLGIESPAGAIRESYEDDPLSGMGMPQLAPKSFTFDPFPDLLTPDKKSRYPSIVVTNSNCFNYITLLGVGGRAGEIPLVLAWMKALRIQPSDSTIAVALVFWAEVTVQAPLVEKWSGGPEKNQYAKLVEWLRAWVGDKRLPHWRTLQKWQGIVNKMRSNPSR